VAELGVFVEVDGVARMAARSAVASCGIEGVSASVVWEPSVAYWIVVLVWKGL